LESTGCEEKLLQVGEILKYCYFENALVGEHGLDVLSDLEQVPGRLWGKNESGDGCKARQGAQQQELVPRREMLRTVFGHLQT